MKFSLSLAAGAGLLLAELAGANILRGNQMVPPTLKASPSALGKRSTGEATFQQLIDHSNPSLGTFSQRYWWSDEFYAGPGSPVVFFTPGEIAAVSSVSPFRRHSSHSPLGTPGYLGATY
jgi:hypothetical protein